MLSVQLLVLHMESAEVVEECFRAAAILCRVEDNKQLFSRHGLEQLVIRGLQRHLQVEEACEQGCLLIRQLLQNQTHNPRIMDALAKSGISKLLPSVMIKYYDNERIAESCCMSLTFIASNEQVNKKLGSASASMAVVAVIEHHLTDPHILSLALKSIAKLNEYEGNITSLRNDGVCAAVAKALNANISTNADLNKSCLEVVASLSKDVGCRSKFILEGLLVENLMRCFALYGENREICMTAFAALAGLCGALMVDGDGDGHAYDADQSDSKQNSDHLEGFQARLASLNILKSTDVRATLIGKLQDSRVCEVVVHMLQTHKNNTDVVLSASSAITALAELRTHRKLLLPCCGALVDTLRTHGELAGLVNMVCLAIGR